MTVFRHLSRISCITALVMGLGIETSSAQSLRGVSGPSELPPASFQGKQFVDSRGCAFIRAGYGQRVTWVPRVSRSRKLLCGFRPTFVASAQQETQQPVRRVVQPKVATIKKPEVQAIESVKSQSVKRTIRSAVLPKVNPNSRIAPRVAPVDAKIAPCVGASALSRQYINQGAGVRCGPQSGSPQTVIRREVLRQGSLNNELRGPKGVNRRITDARRIKPPKGYRTAHDDDRLNPYRGVGTSAGKLQMAAVWSNTVPRYLIDPKTGKRLR